MSEGRTVAKERKVKPGKLRVRKESRGKKDRKMRVDVR
jgi:hypothetical protein